MNYCRLKWYKLDPKAIIPTKTDAAAGFDIYTTETFVRLEPHTQHLFKTGLAVMITNPFWLMAFDRGSTGSKGLHVHCGVIDNDYRGEIFICLKNDNDYPVIITDSVANGYYDEIDKILYYSPHKAIAQLIPVEMPTVQSKECEPHEWNTDTERGEGKLGSSGK